MAQGDKGGPGGRGERDRVHEGPTGPDPIASPAGPPPAQPGQGTPPAPQPGEAPPESPQPAPVMPPGGSSATPLGAGTFALPGQGGASAPFRTMDFWSNRFVGGPGTEDLNRPENQVAGGAAPGNSQRPIDPETLRRIFGGALRGQGVGPGGY